MCTFCHCKGCSFCTALSSSRSEHTTLRDGIALIKTDVGEPRVSALGPSEGCSLGVELQIVREKQLKNGAWHYEARLRFGDWQPGAKVTLDFSRAHKAVEINGDDLCCAAELDGGDTWFRVKLGQRGDELNGFAFEFIIRTGKLNLERSPATVECTSVRPILPSPPPPPPPPHTPWVRAPDLSRANEPSTTALLISNHALDNPCALGGRVKITGIWNAGTSFRGSVVLAVWQAGAVVTIDFNQQAASASSSGLIGHARRQATWREEKGAAVKPPKTFNGDSGSNGNAHVKTTDASDILQSIGKVQAQSAASAVPLNSAPPGCLRFRLGNAADETDGFSFVGHSEGKIGMHPRFHCTLLGEGDNVDAGSAGSGGNVAKASPVVQATIGPTCAALGLSYSVEQKWGGGFKAIVAVRKWQPGAYVTLHYASEGVELLDQWSATRSESVGSVQGSNSLVALALSDAPDEEHHGFGFTARGSQGANEGPTITCKVDMAALALTAVPTALCGMGASHSVASNPNGDVGSFLVRVRLSQWQMGASVTLTFAESVESQGTVSGSDATAPAAVEFSDALGSEHTFELGTHPDSNHGFSFVVRSSSALIQVQSLTCKPRPTDSNSGTSKTMEEAAPKHGSPEAPTGITAHATGCDSVELRWSPAVDNGYAISGYRIYYRRREAASDASFQTIEVPGGGGTAHYTFSGLSGGTTYYFKLRAKNQVGEGKYSARAEAETPSGGVPKSAPAMPSALPSPDCRTIKLKLPNLRAGCHGESFLSVQMRSLGRGTGWSDALAMTAESEVRIGSLDPWEIYEFRAVPHNQKGAGPPSETTGPLMVGLDGPALTPPRVRPVGSASFSLSWADVAGACRPSVRWRVVAARRDNSTFLELTSDLRDSTSFSAHPFRCPSPGCIFRVQAGDGSVDSVDAAGGTGKWAAPSATSAAVASLALPELLYGSVRLELRRRSEHPNEDMLQTSLDTAADIAASLKLEDTGAVLVQEVYGAGKYVVVDVRSARQGTNRDSSSASLLAQQLALLAADDPSGTSGLRAGAATHDVEGVLMLVGGDGQFLTAVHVSDEAKEMMRSIGRWHGNGGGNLFGGGTGGEEGVLSRARKITIALVSLVAFGWLCSKLGGGGEYSAVQQSD